MSIAAVLVYAVTALVAAIVALTYLKPHLLQPQEPGLPPRIHLYAGAAGLVVWVLFLVSPPSFFLGGDVPGVIGLFGIWLAAGAGLYLLIRRLKEQRAAGHDDAYGYDDGYGEEYAAEDGYGYDEPGYAAAGYDDYAEYDDRAAYADPRQSAQQRVAPQVAQPVPQPVADPGQPVARRPERRRAASEVDETAVMAPVEREASPAQPPAPGQARGGQIGRRVAGRQTPQPPAPQPPAPQPPAPQPSAPEAPAPQPPPPARTRQERPAPPRPAPERPVPARPAPERPTPPPPAPQRQAPPQAAPERPAPPRPDQGTPGRSGQDPWGRRQEPPQRRPRGFDGRYDDRRNDSHDEFADRRYRRDSSYSDYPGQPQPAPPRAPRPAPRPAPQPAPQPAPAPTPPPAPQAPSRQSVRQPQQPDAYDPYSFESYGPRDRAERPAQAPRRPQPQVRGRQQSQDYDERAYAGYEQGYDQEYSQGYDYDQAYDRGYDERYDDAYDQPVGGDRKEQRRAFFEASGAALVVHITLVILAIWLTWAYGTSVI